MFAAASSFFSRSNILQNYNVGTAPRSPTPSSSSTGALPTTAHVPPFQVGLWRVQSAQHKTTGKRVSVWTCDKRAGELDRLTPAARDNVMDVLKAEATSLSKLRHPSVLEVVEPLEETRGELIFATEPLLASLYLAIPGSPYGSKLVDLDEVEIQKGILQLCKGLQFLHTSARLIHTNINPESILINQSGDWKIGGLGMTIALNPPDGSKPRWEFPSYDGRLPPYTQRSFDYMAPEYALDEQLTTASDMYSLGCLMFAVHMKGDTPYKNHGSLGSLRENAGKPLSGMGRLDQDLQTMLRMLITRNPQGRAAPEALPTHAFFSSLPISTLNFLERSNFATKSREEKVSFMKGLQSVLDKFSEGLRIRKILPSLLEEMKDTHLLPYILPNVFLIAKIISPTQFAGLVLPSLKPLFVIKDPPQNMLTLLENLQTLQDKTEKQVFQQHVLPLVYNAFQSEHAVVQERALKCVPDLCETIDYAEVQGTMFPRVAVVFTHTRVLSVKVATLATFLAMVKTLDQTSLTQKLVPLLSKIRTKEPAVMMATLAVQEAMGLKVDREAVATLVLPQLWAMCIGPLINVQQFERFMSVIKKLSDRVEREHHQFLRDAQRIEDKSALQPNGSPLPSTNAGPVSFESLVANANGATVKADTVPQGETNWDDDVWGSILAPGSETPRAQSPAPALSPSIGQPSLAQTSPRLGGPSVPAQRAMSRPTGPLGARRIASSSIQPSSGASSPLSTTSFPPPPSFASPPPMSFSSPPPMQALQPTSTGSQPMRPLQPTSTGSSLGSQPMQPAKPNYNISLDGFGGGGGTPTMAPLAPSTSNGFGAPSVAGGFGSFSQPPLQPQQSFSQPPLQPQQSTFGSFSQPPLQPQQSFSPPPLQPQHSFNAAPMQPLQPTGTGGMGMGVLTPNKPANGSAKAAAAKLDWGDFDPLA